MDCSPFSAIYAEVSKTPIYIESTKLINKNYLKYKDASGSKAQNLMIDAEGNGTANVFFINTTFQNSKWTGTVTGVSKNASLNFDEKSSWKLTADKPVKLSVAKLEVTGGGAFKAGRNVAIETRKEDAEEDAE